MPIYQTRKDARLGWLLQQFNLGPRPMKPHGVALSDSSLYPLELTVYGAAGPFPEFVVHTSNRLTDPLSV